MTNDTRIKDIITAWNGESADMGIVGVPFDEAIEAGGGRAGAKEGPGAIRAAIQRYGTTYDVSQNHDFSNLKIVDCGDIDVVANDTRATHSALTKKVGELLKLGIFPIVIGGSHDNTFANIAALADNTKEQIGGINVDAHFDVRPVKDNGVIVSGSPFWRALEELDDRMDGTKFVEFGIDPHANSKEHHEYLKAKGSKIVFAHFVNTNFRNEAQSALSLVGSNAFLSIDIDAVRQSQAPGCSAPASLGISGEAVAALALMAGKNPSIKFFDIMEVSPKFDVDGRTARLAAALIVHFITGFSQR